jgi:hypothetical protein
MEEKIYWRNNPSEALVNIIFVHGVNGHYETTWNRGAGQQTLWTSSSRVYPYNAIP